MRVNRTQIALFASLPFLACSAGGCELVLGDLPTPAEDLTTAASTTTASGGETSGTGAQGGTGGAGASTSASTSTSSGGGGATTTTTGGQGGCCDCDGDDALAKSCGGEDCDDSRDDIYPGETTYYDEPTPNNGFDWDCSGKADRDPALVVTVDCGLIGLPCNQKEGFLGTTVPACGGTGDWGTCVGTLIPCTPQVIEAAKPMKCK